MPASKTIAVPVKWEKTSLHATATRVCRYCGKPATHMRNQGPQGMAPLCQFHSVPRGGRRVGGVVVHCTPRASRPSVSRGNPGMDHRNPLADGQTPASQVSRPKGNGPRSPRARATVRKLVSAK